MDQGAGLQSLTNLPRISCPCCVCVTSRWNCVPKIFLFGSSIAALAQSRDEAVRTKPLGTVVTSSPCDIQTVNSLGSPWKSVPPSPSTVRYVEPYSFVFPPSTFPPSLCAIHWCP